MPNMRTRSDLLERDELLSRFPCCTVVREPRDADPARRRHARRARAGTGRPDL